MPPVPPPAPSRIDRHRRRFLARGLAAATALSTVAAWRSALATARIGVGPYGPPGIADAAGVRVPAGFRARLIAVSGEEVPGTGYHWHGAPDGGAVFARRDGGWIYASNSELDEARGGVGVLGFDAAGEIDTAYRILRDTNWNCAGGPTPWGTWLSCEEIDEGLVWECNPFAAGQGVARPALGRFKHEAAVTDPATGIVYLTEDQHDGRFYRFRPARRRELDAGVLEAAAVAEDGQVRWVPVSPRDAARDPQTTAFQRGEGAWCAHGIVYFSTTADSRVWAYDTRRARLESIYEAAAAGANAVLRYPDNLTMHPQTGALFIAEDGDDMQIVMLSQVRGEREVAPFVQFEGHPASEVTGLAFSPDGQRLYCSSQRGRDGQTGMTFEVSGPFRRG